MFGNVTVVELLQAQKQLSEKLRYYELPKRAHGYAGTIIVFHQSHVVKCGDIDGTLKYQGYMHSTSAYKSPYMLLLGSIFRLCLLKRVTLHTRLSNVMVDWCLGGLYNPSCSYLAGLQRSNLRPRKRVLGYRKVNGLAETSFYFMERGSSQPGHPTALAL